MFTGFGISTEWESFQMSHSVFVEKVRLLFETASKVFRRKVPASASYADKAVFHLGMLCFEDFKEILLLCANGFGIGGQKILRGLYEKTITTDYLSAFPDAAQNFVDYTWVYMKRDLLHAKNEFGEETLDPGFIGHVMKEYDRVKDQFLNPRTGKPRTSWTELSVEAMSKKVNNPLANWYYTCYFLPSQQIHSTIGAVYSRLKVHEQLDATYFSTEPQRDEAIRVARNSHLLMLSVLQRQDEHFALGMENELMERAKDFDSAWGFNAAVEITGSQGM
ncbi:MAG: DUF5677 domain-containing protein [Pyrinomonadaceae bacterium]